VIMIFIIVGIDPGLNTALVFMDLKGKIINEEIHKGEGIGRLIVSISRVGIPVLFACDVKKPPKLVQKICSRFNAFLYSPSRELKKEEKRRLSIEAERGSKHTVLSGKSIPQHIVDARAAALKAYRRYANRFRQIEKRGLDPELSDRLKAGVVRGERVKL